jgi:hypothetical protein
MLYEDIFRTLAEKKIDYVVVGGVALVLHGVVRLTGDLDAAAGPGRHRGPGGDRK